MDEEERVPDRFDPSSTTSGIGQQGPQALRRGVSGVILNMLLASRGGWPNLRGSKTDARNYYTAMPDL